MLDRDRIVSQLNSDAYTVKTLECTASTNTDLRIAALMGAPAGTTVIAATQTSGRGRRGHTFASPTGGLYLSTLLRPAAAINPGQITCLAAVAAARAIESLCNLSIHIKWVNDLHVRGRKVAGILAEGIFDPDGTLSAVVLGIGINVYGVLPKELKVIATTLEQHKATLTREDLAAAFLNEWERVMAEPVEDGINEYARRNMVIGQEITVMQGAETYPATALGITPEGHLLVSTPDGERELSSGEVSIRL